MFKQSYKNNIGLLGATEFFAFFGITSFWLLFLSQNGMSLLEIGLLESLFHATSLLSEVPSGILADRFSYKSNLYLSRLTAILSAVLMLQGQGSFVIYALGMVVGAWSYNFDSGTSSAMLFESAKEAGLEDKYLKFSSYILALGEATRAIGMVLAGFLIHGFLDVTYYIQILLSCIALVFVFLMKEPNIKLEQENPATIKVILQTVRENIKSNPKLLKWIIVSNTLLTLVTMFYFYYQNEMIRFKSWQVSLMMLCSSLVNILAVWLASKIGYKWQAKTIFLKVIPLCALFLLLAWTANPSIYILIFILSDGLVAFFFPIFNNNLQEEIETSVRATMLSVSAMIGSFAMIVIFPLTGFLIDHFGFSTTFFALGIALLLSSMALPKLIT
ncbi:MFS transporter [Streptococcus iniae]|uniref:MFS transporter n=2 Tax=Streptococcus iniae TaxID=1346 RepID=UPI0008DA26A8|nr:MFS transporter [Streptococcus iniae]OHX26414.1 MFS transporter [Streptococcus iniae]RLV28687.1 MFS transporter [Streptococcus iniae]